MFRAPNVSDSPSSAPSLRVTAPREESTYRDSPRSPLPSPVTGRTAPSAGSTISPGGRSEAPLRHLHFGTRVATGAVACGAGALVIALWLIDRDPGDDLHIGTLGTVILIVTAVALAGLAAGLAMALRPRSA